MAIDGQLVTLTVGGDAVEAEVVVGSSCLNVGGDGGGDGVLDSPDLLLVEQILSTIQPLS
jgi:hypothetical protein